MRTAARAPGPAAPPREGRTAPARAAALIGLLAGLMCACGAAPPDPRRVAPDDAIVRIQCDVPEAEVWVDGRFVGPVGGMRGGIAVSPGAHRLELRHERYHGYYAELDLGKRERRTLAVELAEILD